MGFGGRPRTNSLRWSLQVVHLLEEAGKMSDKQTKLRYLRSGIMYLYNLVQLPQGIKHVRTWNIVPKIDPFMRSVRGSLNQHSDGDLLWRQYDALTSKTQT